MAEFTSDFQSFIDIDHMELMNQFKGDNSILNIQNLMMPFSSDTLLGSSESEFPGNLEENFHAASVSLPISSPENKTHHHEVKKRKATDMRGDSSENSTAAVSQSCGRGKRVKKNGTEDVKEKSKEVVHVRARRGQATDSHSLAERVRRGKINEKLKCLQNIVPGCYKTMGMAIMLDEIINYVQSLQNQVEFLSMKLTAASTFYDFNSETDALETLQRGRASEAKGCEGVSCFQSSWF